MDLNELQRKLLATGRESRPSEDVPYAFEKRITALLNGVPSPNLFYWASALWRAAGPCVAIMLLWSAWSMFLDSSSEALPDLSSHFESAVLAEVEPAPLSEMNW